MKGTPTSPPRVGWEPRSEIFETGRGTDRCKPGQTVDVDGRPVFRIGYRTEEGPTASEKNREYTSGQSTVV